MDIEDATENVVSIFNEMDIPVNSSDIITDGLEQEELTEMYYVASDHEGELDVHFGVVTVDEYIDNSDMRQKLQKQVSPNINYHGIEQIEQAPAPYDYIISMDT
jgi:hypothetical protein